MIDNQLDIDKKLNLGRNVYLLDVFCELNKRCCEQAINIVPIKGVLYLHLIYADQLEYRAMSDIDVLVTADDVAKTVDVLAELGYTCDYNFFDKSNPYSCYINSMVFRKETPVHHFIHLHWSILNTSLPLFMFNVDMHSYFRELQGIEFDGIKTTIPSKENIFLHACLHGFTHSYDTQSLVDELALLYDYCEIEFSRDSLFKKAKEWKLCIPLYCSLCLIDKEKDSLSLDIKEKQKQSADQLVQYIKKNKRGYQNQVFPLYLSMCEGLKEKLKFLWLSQFPAVSILKAIYRKTEPKDLFVMYCTRIRTSFIQLKTIVFSGSLKEICTIFGPYLSNCLISVIWISLCLFAIVGAGLLAPYFTKGLVDAVIGKESWTKISPFLMGAVGFFVLNGLLRAVSLFGKKSLRLRVMKDIAVDVFDGINRLPLLRLKQRTSGSSIENVFNDAERSADCLVSSFFELIEMVPKFIFILLIVCALDISSALFSFIFLPILYFIFVPLIKKMRDGFKLILNNEQNIFSYIKEVFSNIYLIKAFKQTGYERDRYRAILDEHVLLHKKNLKYEVAATFLGNGFMRVALGLIVFFVGARVAAGKITAGTFSAIMFYLSQLFMVHLSTAQFFQRLSLGAVSCQRVSTFLNKSESQSQSVSPSPLGEGLGVRPPNTSENITIENISFSYTPDNLILNNFSCKFIPGFNAISGPTGCGKTTLINIILNLYQSRSGLIKLPKGNFAIALQEPYLWNDTVANNITYASRNEEFTSIKEAAKLADVDDFIETLPLKYDTFLGENADFISEGQKQKIALARALVSKPSILIVDEGFSNIDSASEDRIFKNLYSLSWLKIAIIISHRPSTVEKCDNIIYMGDRLV